MSEEWYLWLDGTHSPFVNMAVDEVLLEHAPALGRPLIRIYYWDRPALSIGSSQLYPEKEAARYCIVRRPTGGGNVYHDVDLTYTAVIPPEHAIMKLDRLSSYRIFHEAMLPMLAELGRHAALKPDETPGVDRATMRCFTSPSKFDVVADDGAKYAGAAQRRTRNGILHQGSIQLAASGGSAERLSRALQNALRQKFQMDFISFSPMAELLDAADVLAREKYENAEWNHGSRH